MDYSVLWKPRRLYRAVRRRIVQRRTLRSALRRGKKRFAHDPNFRPDLLHTYFSPRLGDQHDDTAILKRVVSAYNKAKSIQKSAGEAFNVSNEWLPIYRKNLGPVMDALASGDLPALRGVYRNLFRDPCSTGLFGLPVEMSGFFSGRPVKQEYKEYFLYDVLHRFYLWKERTEGKYPVSALSVPDVGNPYGFIIDGLFIRGGADYQHYYSHAISKLLTSAQNSVVLELGGGFGGLAYYLIRDNAALTYVDFDLPEATALASYYLLRCLPDANIQLYGEVELSAAALRTPGVLMMPSFEILRMPSASAAIAFNSYSLAEMSPATIHLYLDQIARITNGYFMHVNHNRNAVLSADSFGMEQRGFKLLNRQLARWTLGTNPFSDEYEYLYARESSSSDKQKD
jgi:hypothetical protein